ncbi:MAG: DUF4935 domain-containing protein [Brevundimonas sp.]|uniref:PIN domain-containing protein n=1 Tax=Brevundimonas sp. TaxID=1871086 RepID=UPI001A333F76|nr:PIN domain-containing protein [Brevundimonas sp.]MBJ7318605.1 DUF4935 domain-containing protein [Brevundimonas sp.]
MREDALGDQVQGPHERKGKHRDAVPTPPLETRHIFLDTQVFRKLGHNPRNRALTLLRDHIRAHRIILHTTDITLLEIKRQIRERVEAQVRAMDAAEKDFVQWRKASPANGPTAPIRMEAEALAADMFGQMTRFLTHDCSAVGHNALDLDPRQIFEKYFSRQPPFHGENSKEFPDAFALAALTQWCAEARERLYVVTEDKAMAETARRHASLLPLKDLHDVLTRATADLDAEGEAIADATLNLPNFDGSFQNALTLETKDVVFIYSGDLPEGEAYGGELISIDMIDGWSVVGLSQDRITLILGVHATVRVEIQFEDRDDAHYDREDGVWFGVRSAATEIDEEVRLEVLVDLDRVTGLVIEARILDDEVGVHGPSDYEY